MSPLKTLFVVLLFGVGMTSLHAAEVAEAVASPWWFEAIWAGIVILFGAIASPWLINRAKELKLEAADIEDDLKRKAWTSLQAYAYERVEARFKRDGYKIARSIAGGSLADPSEVKRLLYTLGEQTKTDLVEYWRDNFSAEFSAKSLYEVFGEKYIDELIDSTAGRVWSVVPGFEVGSTTDNLLRGGARWLVEHAVGRIDDFIGSRKKVRDIGSD